MKSSVTLCKMGGENGRETEICGTPPSDEPLLNKKATARGKSFSLNHLHMNRSRDRTSNRTNEESCRNFSRALSQLAAR